MRISNTESTPPQPVEWLEPVAEKLGSYAKAIELHFTGMGPVVTREMFTGIGRVLDDQARTIVACQARMDLLTARLDAVTAVKVVDKGHDKGGK